LALRVGHRPTKGTKQLQYAFAFNLHKPLLWANGLGNRNRMSV
jgi:hypothetical protein